MFHCLSNVINTKKNRQYFLSPNLGHSWGGAQNGLWSHFPFFKPFSNQPPLKFQNCREMAKKYLKKCKTARKHIILSKTANNMACNFNHDPKTFTWPLVVRNYLIPGLHLTKGRF